MSDLQCPATFVLLTPESLPALDARALRVAGAYVHGSVDGAARSALERASAAHSCKVQPTRAPGGTLLSQLEELADAYRGETVLLLTTTSAACAALRRSVAPAQPVVLAVDSDGVSVLSG